MEKLNLESSLERLPADVFSEAITEDLLNDPEIKKPEKKKRFLKGLCMSIAATTLGLVINHVYQHRDKVGQEGENFTHPDQETEHILNVLCGKEEFTEKEKLLIYKQIVIRTCQDRQIQVPENIDAWSISELTAFDKKIKDPGLTSSQAEEFQEVISSRFFMKNLHHVLWKYEREYGGPKIRWSVPGENILQDPKYNRSYYNSLTNTINLAAENMSRDFFEVYVSEITHAKQFHEEPVSSYVVGAVDSAETLYGSITSNTSFDTEYQKLYGEEGTLEHEAHRVIQQPLETESWRAMASDVEDNYEATKGKGE